MSAVKKPKKSLLDILMSFRVIAASVVIGILIGTQSRTLAYYVAPFGRLYLSLLQMTIYPLLITAIVSSLGNLFLNRRSEALLSRLLMLFVVGMLITGTISAASSLLISPGKDLSSEGRAMLGKLVSNDEMTLESPLRQAAKSSESIGIMYFLKLMVPANPFQAVVKGETLPVVFFSLIFALALGVVGSKAYATIVEISDTLFDTCLRIIQWILYGLPFGLLCLFAGQLSEVGGEMFNSVGWLLATIFLSFGLVLVAQLALLSWKFRCSPFRVIRSLRRTLVLGMATSSSFAALPTALQELEENLNVDRNTANLVLPLGVTLNHQGTTIFLVCVVIFMANLYGVHLDFAGVVIAVVGSIFAGLAIPAIPAVASLSVISVALQPLGLPSEAAIALMIAIYPLLDPPGTVINLLGHICCAAMLGPRRAKLAKVG